MYVDYNANLSYIARLPEQFASLVLPHKLPPPKEALSVTGLPMLGYMEQTASTALIKALTACGNSKPKYPFLSSSRSALFYIAYHLKGRYCVMLKIMILQYGCSGNLMVKL